MQNSGFLYYFDLLGLDRTSYRLHYTFSETSGNLVQDYSDAGTRSGLLSSVGNFHAVSGSGLFTGQTLTIQNATGLQSSDWTHLFIFEKSGSARGTIFDSLVTGAIYSGYRLGVNDANKFYFESYDSNGPSSRTSNSMLGVKNCAAITKNNNLVTFYCANFNNNQLIGDSVTIQGNYTLFSNQAVIGNRRDGSSPFKGYFDEYVYLAEGVNPSTLTMLFSGLLSDYTLSAPPVTSFTTTGILGYASGVTGVTGIIGYQNVITGSGLDPFGTMQNFYMSSGVTGYLVSGLYVAPITGEITNYITGDATPVLTLHSGQLQTFNLDEISFVKKFYTSDRVSANLYTGLGGALNLLADFDLVNGEFQLDNIYTGDSVKIFNNGVLQSALGSVVTGDFYNSGISISGDYMLDGFYAISQGNFEVSDVIVYDVLSGVKAYSNITGAGVSGRTENLLIPSNPMVYLNGVLVYSGIDYLVNGGYFTWANNSFSGISGMLSAYPRSNKEMFQSSLTGISFPRSNTQLFLNGVRQTIFNDYIENSSIDLIGQSGIFETGLSSIYNRDDNFFEG